MRRTSLFSSPGLMPLALLCSFAALASAQTNFNSGIRRDRVCRTVGGPNPNADCVFPFVYKGRRYSGCPVDPQDSSQRWCSTRVDSNGVHVGGQGQYGQCGAGCPRDNAGTDATRSSSSSSSSGGGRGGTRSRGCSRSEECRSIGECALRFTPAELEGKECSLPGGSGAEKGLCCSDLTNSALRSDVILPEEDDVRPGPPISNFDVRAAVFVGETFYDNVTREIDDSTRPVRRGTPQASHTAFQRARRGVTELNEVGLVAMEASRNLDEPAARGGVRSADVGGTELEQCYDEIRCDPRQRFREIDGTCNNLRVPIFGKLNTPLSRILPNAYADGYNLPRVSANGQKLPSSRLVSTTTTGSASSPNLEITALLMSFGQFVDHDVTHVPIQNNGEEGSAGLDCCLPGGRLPSQSDLELVECFPIPVPSSDPAFDVECINFPRSMTAPRIDCFPGPSEQINQITHWLDSSNVYGSDEDEARSVRSFRNGLLSTSPAPFGGMDLLPEDPENEECRSTGNCFLAGDSRVNEQPNLAVMHTLFVREHNRIAGELGRLNRGNRDWDDERIYQESKRIVNAEWQHMVYNEFLPVLIGPRFMDVFGLWPLNTGFSNDYRDDFDPRVTNEFAVAAFRVGHTLIPSLVNVLSKQQAGRGSVRSLLRDMFGNIDVLRTRFGVDRLTRGLTGTPVENVDDNFSEEITEFLFDGDVSQLDLVALNLQRGRDHGIPGYIEYRQACRIDGGKKVRNFNDLGSNISREKINRLRKAYKNVADIDLFVGMYLEDPNFNGGLVGQTFLCLIGDQFARLKKGDRFFYDLGGKPGSFTLEQLDQIRKVTFSRLACDNNDDIHEMQPLAFQLPTSGVNALTSCDGDVIPRVDLSVFRDSGRRRG